MIRFGSCRGDAIRQFARPYVSELSCARARAREQDAFHIGDVRVRVDACVKYMT